MTTEYLPDRNFSLTTKIRYSAVRYVDRRFDGSLSGKLMQSQKPAKGRLDLYLSSSKAYIASTIADIDGTYRFDNLNPDLLYDVVATLDGEEWEKKVSSRRRPSVFNPTLDFWKPIQSGENVRTDLLTDPL